MTAELVRTDAGTMVRTGDVLEQSSVAVRDYLAGLSTEVSRYTTERRLSTAARILMPDQDADAWTFPWLALDWQHVNALRTVLAATYAPATCNAILTAVRRVLLTGARLGGVSYEHARRAGDVPSVKGTRERPGRDIPPGELTALVNAAANNDRQDMATRDVAVLAVLRAGLRLAEVVDLDLDDVTLGDESSLVVRRGKGNKQRRVDLTAAQADALSEWLAVRGDWSGPLFVSFERWGDATRDRLGRESVRGILDKLADRAGVDPVTPHDWRRTLIGDLLDADVDLVTVRDIVGHADVNTTASYDRRGRRARQDAMRRIVFPRPKRPLAGG